MPSPPEPLTTSPLLAALGLDLESSLGDEPRFLQDARLLGALHAELNQELGPDDGGVALLQMGFVHGLRDARRVVRRELRPSGVPSTGPGNPRVAMRIAPLAPGSDPSHGIGGSWPERQEAEAILSSLGRQECPRCLASAGYTSGWLTGLFGNDMLAVETACSAGGDRRCRFDAREASVWRHEDLPAANRLLGALPFAALHRLVEDAESHAPAPPPESHEPAGRFESGSPVIHVWGPVMVIPFSGVDESLQALDLIGSDPGARQVRVVVVDLSEAIIDEGFGAVALEQILGAIESWGAEPLLAGVSPLSASVVDGLSRGPLLVQKDLAEAIAKAFQIAEAQRLAL